MNRRLLPSLVVSLSCAGGGWLTSPFACAAEAFLPYNPPPVPQITSSTGSNPYLIYVTPRQETPVLPPAPAVQPEAPAVAPAAPKAKNGPTLADMEGALRSYFSDEELSLLIDYAKAALMASLKGEDVYLSPDLAFKLEVLLVRMQKMGASYLDNLIKQMEHDLKHSLRETLRLPKTESTSSSRTPPRPPSGDQKSSAAPY